jgi:hypothetical protein
MAPYLLFYPVLDIRETSAGMPNREVLHPAPAVFIVPELLASGNCGSGAAVSSGRAWRAENQKHPTGFWG